MSQPETTLQPAATTPALKLPNRQMPFSGADNKSLQSYARLNVLVAMLRLSLTEISNASGRAVSRSQVWRIMSQGQRATSREKRAITEALRRLMAERLDSSVLFEEPNER